PIYQTHILAGGQSRPIEDDFYSAWIKFVEQIIDTPNNNQPDVILHRGDFFDTPAGYDISPPPEYARKVAAMTFKQCSYSISYYRW
ncbi:MAG TPA: hypothetical protein VFJ51_04965, partial [Nitrososphaeraceae archaeon]|nr:hypothetical protein [Nitrososphaeraceae archaeon]